MPKPLWCFFGILFLTLGGIGVVVPLLPTTPFVLLSAACFSRGSLRLHRWLIEHRFFGPIILNWQAHRALSPRVKRRALLMIVVSFAFSFYVIPIDMVKGVVSVIGAILFYWIYQLPERELIAPNRENGKI